MPNGLELHVRAGDHIRIGDGEVCILIDQGAARIRLIADPTHYPTKFFKAPRASRPVAAPADTSTVAAKPARR